MAHRISFAGTTGKAEMAYTGENPWHGLGTKVDTLQTASAMLSAAGLDWTVQTEPVHLSHNGQSYEIAGHRAIVRQDTRAVLGMASPRYVPIQNQDNGALMDAIIAGGAHVEVAGALDGGARAWLLAHIPADFEVVKGDLVKSYILISWGHDGQHRVTGRVTPVRVVCHNTLTAAEAGKASFAIKHTRNAGIQIDAAREALGLATRSVESTAELFRMLAARPILETQAREYFAAVFPKPEPPKATESIEQAAARLLGTVSDAEPLDRTVERLLGQRTEAWQKQQDTLEYLYSAGKGAAPGSAWGAYNAVTRWTDHVYPVTQSGKVSTTRQQSVLFGSYGQTKDKALELAAKL